MVVCFGSYWDEIKTLGSADRGMTFKQVSAGGEHVLLLRTDGRVMGCIIDVLLQFRSPQPEAGVIYLQVSAGFDHSLLLNVFHLTGGRG